MGVFEQFPYVNMHEMNLDWLLKKMKELDQAMETFKATESLKFANPIIWDITTQYQKSTIVIDPTGNAYMSLKPVPTGVQLHNTEYWLEIFNFTAYTRTANNNLTVNVEINTTQATNDYDVDDWLIWDDVLYRVTAAISVNDVLEIGTNLVHFTVEDFIKAFMTWTTNTIQQYKNDIDASELAYRNQLAGDITSTTASLQAQLDAAIAGATVDSEVINARIGANGVTYATLGDAIREQITDLKNIIEDTDGLDIINFTFGYQIQTNVSIGDTVDVTPFANSNAKYAIIPVNAGDVFTLNLVGGSGARGWARTDSSYHLIVKADANETLTNTRIVIPNDGTAYLILNSVLAGLNMNCYRGDIVDYRLNKAISVYPRTAIAGDISLVLPDLNNAEHNKIYKVVAANRGQLPANTPSWAPLRFHTVRLKFHFGTNVNSDFDSQFILDTLSGKIVAYRNYTSGVWDANWTMANQKQFYIVNPDGSADFTTISDAITGTDTGDTILIMPGLYEETVHMFNKKRNLIGVNKDECIIYSGSGLYADPAAEISIGSVKNLTFISGNDNSIAEHTPTRKAYAVHIEYGNVADYSVVFDDCRFISDLNAGVGIGCRYNQRVEFHNCYFETKATEVYSSTLNDYIESGGLLFHNDGNNDLYGNGYLIVDNCEIVGTTKAIMCESLENNSYMTVRFKDTIAHIAGDGISDIVGYWGSATKGTAPYFCGTCIELDRFSYGNLSNELNYDDYWS